MAAPYPFSAAKGLPARQAFAVTPHDSNELAKTTLGLYVGVTGDVRVVMAGDGGTAVTFTGLAAGVIHPLQVRRVLATGTTATNIVGVV